MAVLGFPDFKRTALSLSSLSSGPDDDSFGRDPKVSCSLSLSLSNSKKGKYNYNYNTMFHSLRS